MLQVGGCSAPTCRQRRLACSTRLQRLRLILSSCGAAADELLSPLRTQALSCACVSGPLSSPFLSCSSCTVLTTKAAPTVAGRDGQLIPFLQPAALGSDCDCCSLASYTDSCSCAGHEDGSAVSRRQTHWLPPANLRSEHINYSPLSPMQGMRMAASSPDPRRTGFHLPISA